MTDVKAQDGTQYQVSWSPYQARSSLWWDDFADAFEVYAALVKSGAFMYVGLRVFRGKSDDSSLRGFVFDTVLTWHKASDPTSAFVPRVVPYHRLQEREETDQMMQDIQWVIGRYRARDERVAHFLTE